LAPTLTIGVYPTNVTAFRQALAYAPNVTQINSELNGPYPTNPLVPKTSSYPHTTSRLGSMRPGLTGIRTMLRRRSRFCRRMASVLGEYARISERDSGVVDSEFRTNEPYSQSVATLLASQWSNWMTITPVIVPSATLRAGQQPCGWQVIVCGVLGPQTNTGSRPGLESWPTSVTTL